jgi:hypothetical protein
MYEIKRVPLSTHMKWRTRVQARKAFRTLLACLILSLGLFGWLRNWWDGLGHHPEVNSTPVNLTTRG